MNLPGVNREQTNHSERNCSYINRFLCLFVLTMNHLQANCSEGNRSPMTRLPERTADVVGCAGPAECSGGWACRWAGPEE